MKYLLAQPANERFKWELDVLFTNLFALDPSAQVVLLFLREDSSIPRYFQSKYPAVEIHVFEDGRDQRNYLPTIRPYLIWRYLSAYPDACQEDYFQIDTDVIFRELPDFGKMPLESKVCWVSDCSSYLGWEYLISRTNGQQVVDKFSGITGLSVDKLRTIPGGGAQWLFTKPTAQLWWHTWQDSQLIYDALQPIQSDIQKWTAEMWAQLYNLEKFGWKVKISTELAFCRPTDPIGDYEKTNILHNAGVVGTVARDHFYKGDYLYSSPFGKDLSYVSPEKASWHYARAIEKAYYNNA